MPIISTNFLIGIFFVLYAPVAFATPAAVTPNTAGLLVPRVPDNNMCGQMQWRSRQCAPDRTPQSWDDVCENDNFDIRVPGENCPQNTYCENILDVDANNQLIETIQCVAGTAPGVSKSRKRAKDPQIGSSSKKQAVTSLANSQLYHELIIADDMLASVAAFILSIDETAVVDPVNVIVGKIRGKEVTVCKGDSSSPANHRECHPTGRQQLWLGDTIDFSWGMKSAQEGVLKYTVWPS